MPIRVAASIIVGCALGIAGSRFLFVGSWLSLVPWGLVGLAVGAVSPKREAILNGGLFGFALAFSFMLSGYAGAAPVLGKVPFFALLGVFGAACGIGLALVGTLLKKRPTGTP